MYVRLVGLAIGCFMQQGKVRDIVNPNSLESAKLSFLAVVSFPSCLFLWYCCVLTLQQRDKVYQIDKINKYIYIRVGASQLNYWWVRSLCLWYSYFTLMYQECTCCLTFSFQPLTTLAPQVILHIGWSVPVVSALGDCLPFLCGEQGG